MRTYVDARSILTGGGVLLAVGALVPLVLVFLLDGSLGGGGDVFLLVSLVSAAGTVLVAVGAALVGAGVVVRALEQGGLLGADRETPEGR